MLLHHPVELLGVLLAGLLVPLKQAAEVERALQRRVAMVGSSVLLAGPHNITLIHSVQWEHLNGTASHTILQYERHNLTIHMPYIARAHLHASNGSLLLEDLQESDSGIYRVTVNRAERESLTILLDVLKPVSHPQLWSRGLVAKASGEVLCEVAEGRADTFTWKKDGQMLPPDRSYHLSGSLSVLHLRVAKKSDCGSYSCNASNGISWQETSLNVTVAGLSPPLQDVLRISVVAVVFAAVSGWGIIFPVCQSEKLRISPSIAVIVPEIFLLYVIVITFLVAFTVTFQPTKLIQLKSTADLITSVPSHAGSPCPPVEAHSDISSLSFPWPAQRTMGYAAPGGVLLVVVTSSFHMKNIHQRHEEGCTAFMDVTTLVVSTAAVLALPILAIFLCYHTTQGWLQEHDSSCADKERSFEMSLPISMDPDLTS
ncbi:uncharacterized protein LOC422295 isoform X4 [Gallus gallus]|uniref:uncharacterized protein LOC422295 isoform X4 n=1 Tax=Gallus gallus TaxID=9031 RepID=UPI001AE3D9F1|nr:uncharacterized protein LOC422295 isoform X4 [Gallus gallus]